MVFFKILLTIFLGGYAPYTVVMEIFYIAGLIRLLPKSGINGKWAFVPCARDYMLARCADREVEGRGYCILSFFSIVSELTSLLSQSFEAKLQVSLLLSLLAFIFTLAQFIFAIRIYSGLIEIYNVRKIWLFGWIFFGGPVAFIWGFSPRFNPLMKAPDLRNDSLLVLSGASAAEMDQGLTVNLESRTVMDFFKKKYLLRDIHMYIKPGRMVLLLGGSGAGKTTFLNAVNGYEKADAKVTLNGKGVYDNYKSMQYEMGFVPQQDLMRGKDTVYSTLMDTALLRLPMDLNSNDLKKRINDVMDIFGLQPVKGSLVEKLSGGQKKRLSIAMEMLSNPSLFILDEPDSGLDGVMARELMVQLRRIADQGRIVIVITHTPDRVIDLFDDVIVLAKDSARTGRLAFYGSIEEARTFFGKEKMEEIVKSVNRVEEGGEGLADHYIEKYVEVQNA